MPVFKVKWRQIGEASGRGESSCPIMRAVMYRILGLPILAAALCWGPRTRADDIAGTHMPVMVVSPKLGSVSFANSCKPSVSAEFDRGVALLHSFWLDEAEKTFRKVAAAEPDCAMAYWGIAMADFNQVNGGPTAAGVAAADQALAKADSSRERDAREAAYIQATRTSTQTLRPAIPPYMPSRPAIGQWPRV